MPLDAYRFRCSACGALEVVDLPLNATEVIIENKGTSKDLDFIESNLFYLTKRSQPFAQNLVDFYKKNGYLTEKQWDRVLALVKQIKKLM